MLSDEQGIELLREWLAKAREKHPVFAATAYDAYLVIADEVFELRHAVGQRDPQGRLYGGESRERQREEALDVAVTALRFAIGEHEHDDR